jgi:hypothetical protein
VLKKITWPVDNKIDVIPSDYAADMLIQLLLKPTLQHSRYHISAGIEASPSWNEINTSFSKGLNETPKKEYKTVDFKDITESNLVDAFGLGPTKHFRRGLKCYYDFAELDVVFDNGNLLSEGLPLPPKFTTLLDLYLKTSAHRSVYMQMEDN